MLKRLGVDHERDRQTDRQTDGQAKAIQVYSDHRPISIKSTPNAPTQINEASLLRFRANSWLLN